MPIDFTQEDGIDFQADDAVKTPAKFTSPVIGAVRGFARTSGLLFPTYYYKARASGLSHADAMREANNVVSPIENAQAEGIGTKLSEAAGGLAPFLAQANPFMKLAGLAVKNPFGQAAIGLGGLAGAKAAFDQKSAPEIAKETAVGAATGAAFAGGAKLGSTLFKRVPFTDKVLNPRIGSAIGSAAVGAATSPSDPITGAVMAGGLGALSPARPFERTPEQHMQRAVEGYRKVFQPNKSIIQKVEVKSGKSLDDAYSLMAQSRIVPEKTADGKLDTNASIEKLEKGPISYLYKLSNDIVSSNPERQFNLNELRKAALQDLKSNPKFKNDLEQKKAVQNLNDEIDAAIENRGEMITAKDLNEIKQGLWGKGYDLLQPNSKAVARQIGFTAKGMLEKAYPDENLKDVNNLLGDYLTVKDILEASHGNVINKGKVGRYAAQIIGAAAGGKIPVVGHLAGGWLGGKMSDFLNNPSTITAGLSKNVPEGAMPIRSFKPEILDPIPGDFRKQAFSTDIPFNKPLALPAPKDVPYNPTGVHPGARNQKITPYSESKEPIALGTSMKYKEGHINRIVEAAGGKVKKITDLKDSIYEDEPTIYIDMLSTTGLMHTITIRPSELSIANVRKKAPENVTSKTSDRDLRYYRQAFRKLNQPAKSRAIDQKLKYRKASKFMGE